MTPPRKNTRTILPTVSAWGEREGEEGEREGGRRGRGGREREGRERYGRIDIPLLAAHSSCGSVC